MEKSGIKYTKEFPKGRITRLNNTINLGYRGEEILSLIPEDVKNILDVGSLYKIFNKYETTTLDIEDADIIQDLNKKQKIDLEDNSRDMVALSQILEHLTTTEEIIDEARRISKTYILIGLPNEATIDIRIKCLFGSNNVFGGYDPYGHKHRFSIKRIEEYIQDNFGEHIKKKYIFGCTGGRFLSDSIKRYLAKTFPRLFANEIYYLIKLK